MVGQEAPPSVGQVAGELNDTNFLAGGTLGLMAGASGEAEEGVLVTEEGLRTIEDYLATLDPSDANEMMINRLRESMGTTVQGADKNFYEHELAESGLVENGSRTRRRTTRLCNRMEFQALALYHPDVISAVPYEFNLGWRAFWGLP
jgi:hypothetical protein